MKAYAQDLAWEMHVRGVSDDDIRRTVTRIRRLEQRGVDPAARFGTPSEFAETFAPSSDIDDYDAFWPLVGVAGAFAWMVGSALVILLWHVDPPTESSEFIFYPALAVMTVGVLAGLFSARRRVDEITTSCTIEACKASHPAHLKRSAGAHRAARTPVG